jgi:cell division septal protein FtsQ
MHKHIGANRRKKHSDKRQRIGKAVTTALTKGATGTKFLVIAVVVIGGASYGALKSASWMKRSPLLTVSSVSVEGSSRIDKKEILRLSGIKTGMHMLNISPSAAEKAIEKEPWVKTASVVRRFPHTVVVRIRERTPIALVSAGRVYYADDDGMLLPMFKGTYSNLPLITGIAGVRPDSVPRVGTQALNRIKRLLDQCKSVDAAFAKRVSQIDFSNDPVIRLSLNDMPVVVEMEDTDTKVSLARLKQLVESLEGNVKGAPAHIDLRYEDLAFLRW